MAKEKEHLNLAFIGHVDHGKSTLVGNLPEKTNSDLLWILPKKNKKEE